MAVMLTRLFALLFGSYILTLSAAFQSLLLPVRGGLEGFPTFALGLLGSTWALGFVGGSILAPKLVARVGHIRSFSIMCALSAVIVLCNLLWIDPWFWVATRIMTGFCMAGSFMIVESWLSEQSTSQNRGAVFGSYMMVVTLGYTTGQLGFSLFDPVAYVPFIVGAIGYCLALLPTALSTTTQPAPLSSTKLEVRVLFATSPVALVSILLIGISNGAFGTLGPVFAQQLELSTEYIAYFISAATIGGALLQFPLGKLSDLVDRRKVIAGVALAAAILSVVLALRSGSAPLLLCAMSLVYGMLIYTIYPIAISHANDWATNISPAQVSGTLLLVYGVGTMIGPIFASAAMAGMGPAGLFWFTCAAHAGIFSYSLWRVMVKTPVPAEDKGSFAAFPLSRAQTPETLAFDPRIEDEADWKED